MDVVAGGLGVGEPLEQEQCCALAHHEPIGTLAEGAGAGRRQCTDLAELDERAGAHVGVDATGQHGVVGALLEPFDGGVDRRHRRRARGVDDEVGPVEVEQVRQPAGDDVGQLAGHRVLGDRREAPVHPGPQFLDDRRPDVGG